MKKYNTYYYLLFVLLVMGGFASMAQNSYGFKIMGLVAFIFGLLFVTQLVYVFKNKSKIDYLVICELIGLFTISIILGLRVYYIHFELVELLFGLAGGLLMAVYGVKAVQLFKEISPKNKVLALLVLCFYVSLILYILSMTVIPFLPALSEVFGLLALIFLIIFSVISLRKKQMNYGSDKATSISVIAQNKDRSIVLMSLFLLFTVYMGLSKLEVLPKMYSDEFPQAYFELVNTAEMGQGEALDGKYKHEEFKEKFEKFLENAERRNIR
jgi:drug/metabolite transporter (DMT)-like permease